MPASESIPISSTFEEEILQQEFELEGHTFQPSKKRKTEFDRSTLFTETQRDRRLLFQEFRAQALQREIHERYAPLRPSPLRDEIRRENLPDPDEPQSDSTEGSTCADSSSESSSDD